MTDTPQGSAASDPLWEQAEREFPNDIALRRIRHRELSEPARHERVGGCGNFVTDGDGGCRNCFDSRQTHFRPIKDAPRLNEIQP